MVHFSFYLYILLATQTMSKGSIRLLYVDMDCGSLSSQCQSRKKIWNYSKRSDMIKNCFRRFRLVLVLALVRESSVILASIGVLAGVPYYYGLKSVVNWIDVWLWIISGTQILGPTKVKSRIPRLTFDKPRSQPINYLLPFSMWKLALDAANCFSGPIDSSFCKTPIHQIPMIPHIRQLMAREYLKSCTGTQKCEKR